MATMLTIRRKETMPRPLARIAVTSLSAASRLRPSRMPMSTHRNGEREERRQQVADEAEEIKRSSNAAHCKLKQRQQVAHEQDEGEEHAAEQGVADDLAKNVAGEDEHVRSACRNQVYRAGFW